MVTPQANTDTSYWLSKQLNITFSPYEDRLIVKAERGEHGTVNLLLTRRMVMIILHQLLVPLAEISGLSKTPAQYWQEVLQMAHQQAMQAKSDADKVSAASAASGIKGEEPKEQKEPVAPPALYLATELTVRVDDKQLILAFKGLPMPKAMNEPSAHEPVFATPLQSEHVHQLIQLLITKAQEAQWHLPLDLPWLQNPTPESTSLGGSVH